MRQSEGLQSSVPYDITLKIASLLPVRDVCSLGSCSRFWRELCESDSVWKNLFTDRWPEFSSTPIGKIPALDLQEGSSFKQVSGWKGIYINMHNAMACRASLLTQLIQQHSPSESIEVVHYLLTIQDLCSMKFGFKDVQMFLFKPKLDVLLNLVGLDYCMSCLEVPAENIVEALYSCEISDREVCVRWWKLGRWFHGFRLRDEPHSRQFSLGDLAMAKEEEVLGVLHRGAIHEVLRVQISAAKPLSTPWSCQSSPSPN